MRHLKRICKDACRVAGAVQETCSSEMFGGQGANFLVGCILEHQIFSFAKMILRGRGNTSYDLASLSMASARWSGTIGNRIGRRPSALHSTFHFEEVSQNCFVWCCRKLGKSGRIASFLTLLSSNIGEVSQNCCASDVAKSKNWGSLAE